MARTKLTVRLECGHDVQFAHYPDVGESLVCLPCGKPTRVTGSSEVVAACRDCTLNRKYANVYDAHTAVRAHLTRYPDHHGFLMSTDVTVTNVTVPAVSDTLDL